MIKISHKLSPLWSVSEGEGALFATALHSGHKIRHEMKQILLLDDATRLREEDPYTEQLAKISQNHILPLHSRFEVDLNRTRDEAVYLEPEDAWGLKVWKHRPGEAMINRSLQEFDQFYIDANVLLKQLEQEYGHFVVFDLHSYNYRRKGPDAPPDDPLKNPDINIGTGTMEREKWARLIDHFIKDLKAYHYEGGHLDVRENVKFKGRQFAKWVHSNFSESGCVLSIEIKKIFMDEWTGTVNKRKLKSIFFALKSSLPGISEELQRL